MIVVDASVALDIVLGTSAGVRIAARIRQDRPTLHAPHLIDVEVAHVLRRFERAKALTAGRAKTALDDFAALRLRRYPHRMLLPRVWELRANLTGYDAAYVALAEFLTAPLWTRDGRLASSPGHHAKIDLV